MKTRLQHRLLKGFAAQGFGQLVNLVVQICSVPFYLHYWGKVRYGEWLLMSSVLGYLSISDLSFGTAAQNEMTLRVAGGDKEGAVTVFQSAWLVVTAVSLAFMLISLAAVSRLPLETWLHLKPMSHASVVSIVSLLVLQVILAQQGCLLGAGLRCDGNYARGVMANNCLRLAEFLVGIITVAYGGSFAVLALTVLLTRIIGYIALYLVLRHLSPWLRIGFRQARIAVLKPLVGPALAFNALPLGAALSLQGVLTVVGIYAGPAAVTVFATSRALTRLIAQLLNAIVDPIWVELSTAFGSRDISLARRLHRRASQAALWGSLLTALILVVAGGPIYRFWLHGKVPFDAGLLHLLLVVAICSSLWSASYVVPMAINRHQRLALVYLLATSLTLLVAIVLVRRWGIHGAAIALLIEEVTMIIYVVRRSLHLVEDNVAGYVAFVLTPPVSWLKIQIARILSK